MDLNIRYWGIRKNVVVTRFNGSDFLGKCSVKYVLHVSETFQPVIKYSKLTIVTLEQGVKYIHKLTIKTPVRRQSIFIFNFEHIQTLF